MYQSSAWDGKVTRVTTHEYKIVNGEEVRVDGVRANFKSYCSVWYAYRDHSLTIRNVKYYKNIWNCVTVECWASILGQHWATSPTYSQKLLNLIERYDLTQYDDPNLIYGYHPDWREEAPIAAPKETLYKTDTLVLIDTIYVTEPRIMSVKYLPTNRYYIGLILGAIFLLIIFFRYAK